MSDMVLTLCLLRISEQSTSFALHNVTWLFFFTTEEVSVFYEVRTESLYIKQITFHA